MEEEEEVYVNHFDSTSPSSWMPGQEKMVVVVISPSPSSEATTTAALSHSNSNSSMPDEEAVHTPATSADSKGEHGRVLGMKMEIGGTSSASVSGLPEQNQGPDPAEDNDNDHETPVPTYSWILPSSQTISPPARAASPSTASSASASASSSSSENNSAASSLALFIKSHVTRLRENPRPILANRLSNLGPMRPEGRISRWMVDVEAQMQQQRGTGDQGSREGEEEGSIGRERGYGTLDMSGDRRVVAKRTRGGMREDLVYGSEAQASEDECETGDGCACGCWWQWVLLTIVVLALIAWGLWAFLGDRDMLGMKQAD